MEVGGTQCSYRGEGHQPWRLLRGFYSKVSLSVEMVALQCAITDTPYPPSLLFHGMSGRFASDLEMRIWSPCSLTCLVFKQYSNCSAPQTGSR